MASAGEYKEDAQRIERDYTDPESVDEDQLREDLEDADFAQAAIEDVVDWFNTREEVREMLGEPHEDGITTRKDVEVAVEATDEVGYSSERTDALTDAVSSEVGAPTAQEAQRAQLSAVNESVSPGDVIEGDERTTPVSVVRDTSGDVVGTVGSPGTGRDVAEAVGGEYLGGPKDLADRMSVRPAPGGDEGLVYVDDSPVGEVEIE